MFDKLPFKINLNLDIGNIFLLDTLLIMSLSGIHTPLYSNGAFILLLGILKVPLIFIFFLSERFISKKGLIKAREGIFTQM